MPQLRKTEFLEILEDFTDWLEKEVRIEFRFCEEGEHPQCVNMDKIRKHFEEYFTKMKEKTDIFELLYIQDD